MRIAVPSKGRLREPTIELLHDAGLGPETPGDRALAFPCRNAPIEALLVRADDIPEYVQDGVVDCGITGLDIVRERSADVIELARLGFGACSLEAAVPTESAIRSLADLAGARVATSFPRLARELLPGGLELVDVHGSVELAPRLGLADAIVDLVSSGSTLRRNGLRSVGRLLVSEAVLVGPARAVPADVTPERAVLALADRVRRWHELQRPADIRLEVEPGVELERRWVPLRSVGVYVPRSLVSTLVMCVVPAQVARVERIVVVTPPAGASLVAAAAALLGVDEVWVVGGAQAIAALAYGTETIARVDKIVGPGNAYVNEAKLLVSRDVAIDLPAGPSEVVVVLGRGAAREVAELELAAQAEHGRDAVCELVDGSERERPLAQR